MPTLARCLAACACLAKNVTHLEVRRRITEYITTNRVTLLEQWDGFTPDRPDRQRRCTFTEYLDMIGRPGAWGGELELQALGRLHPDRPVLVLGPQSPPTAFGDRAIPLPPATCRIALWLEAGHIELITSHVPDWVWQSVWQAGRPQPEQETGGAAAPEQETGGAVALADADSASLHDVRREMEAPAPPEAPQGVSGVTCNLPDRQSHKGETGQRDQPQKGTGWSGPADLLTTARALSPRSYGWWLAAPVDTIGSLVLRLDRGHRRANNAIEITILDERGSGTGNGNRGRPAGWL